MSDPATRADCARLETAIESVRAEVGALRRELGRHDEGLRGVWGQVKTSTEHVEACVEKIDGQSSEILTAVRKNGVAPGQTEAFAALDRLACAIEKQNRSGGATLKVLLKIIGILAAALVLAAVGMEAVKLIGV